MKIDFDVVLMSIKGEPLKTQEGVGEEAVLEDMTLEKCVMESLLQMLPSDKSEDGKSKYKRYQLAQKIENNPDAEFKAEEIAKIKKRIGLAYGPAVVGSAWEAIEGTKEKDE